MLKNIPSILPPMLLKVLAEMGHGDEITLADANFPGCSCSNSVIRMDGHGILPILDAILQVFPLDTYVPYPLTLMQVPPENPVKTGLLLCGIVVSLCWMTPICRCKEAVP